MNANDYNTVVRIQNLATELGFKIKIYIDTLGQSLIYLEGNNNSCYNLSFSEIEDVEFFLNGWEKRSNYQEFLNAK